MPETFKITQEQVDQIIDQAVAGSPREICGMMGGKDSEVLKIFATKNVDDSDTTYKIDPGEQFKIMKQLRDEGLELVGIYHSHPKTEAYPSPTDKKLAFYPEAHYVIVSLANEDEPVIRVFKILDDLVTESTLKVVEN